MGKSKQAKKGGAGRKRTKSTICAECSDRECNFIEQCPRDWGEMVKNAHIAGRKRWKEPTKYELNHLCHVTPPVPEMMSIKDDLVKQLGEVLKNKSNLFTTQLVMQMSSICFDLAYVFLMMGNFVEAENSYAEGMNATLQLLNADPQKPDVCFTYFKRLVTAGHTNYCVIKYDRQKKQPCGKTIMMYMDILGSPTLAHGVETLVPLLEKCITSEEETDNDEEDEDEDETDCEEGTDSCSGCSRCIDSDEEITVKISENFEFQVNQMCMSNGLHAFITDLCQD